MPWDIHWPSSSFQSMPCDTIRCTTRSSQGWDDGEEGGYVPMPHPRQERNMEEGMPGVSWFSSNPGHSNNKKFSFYRFISSLKTQGCGFKSDFSFLEIRILDPPPKIKTEQQKLKNSYFSIALVRGRIFLNEQHSFLTSVVLSSKRLGPNSGSNHSRKA